MTDALYMQYLSFVTRYLKMFDGKMTKGRVHLVVLYIGHPWLANMIVGTEIDPSKDDERLGDFLDSVYHVFRVIEEI